MALEGAAPSVGIAEGEDWLILRWCETQIWGERSGSCLRSQKHPVPPPGPAEEGERGRAAPTERKQGPGGRPVTVQFTIRDVLRVGTQALSASPMSFWRSSRLSGSWAMSF